MKALVKDNLVIQVQEESFPVHPDYQWIDCDTSVRVEDTWDGENFHHPIIPEPTDEEKLLELNNSMLFFIDFVARGKIYNDAVSCASYVDSTNAQWASEATTFISWRDAVYNYAIAQEALMQSGQRSVPTFEEFQAELPVIVWPD